MPTISLTAKDLRQILENSRSYDEFARSRPVFAKVPAYGRRYRQRSRSRSKSRSRARSASQSRVPNRVCRCCNLKQCELPKPLPPGLPRPRSATTRPRSAKFEYGERPLSAQTGPQSGKASLPKRPSSAQPRSRNIDDYESRDMDFSGLSNMMRQLTFQPTRKWKSKSPSRENNKKRSDITKDQPVYKEPVVDTNLLRKSRSSTYAKFKYPEKYHMSSINRHLHIEENIPQCLRKFPRYINQPKRHNCNYNPQGSAVSWVTSHNIKSGNLPPQIRYKTKARGPSGVPRIAFDQNTFDKSEAEPVNVIGTDTFRDSDDDDERQRNGTFNYVFNQSKQSDVILDMDDLENDVTNGNEDAHETVRTSNTLNEHLPERPATAQKASRSYRSHRAQAHDSGDEIDSHRAQAHGSGDEIDSHRAQAHGSGDEIDSHRAQAHDSGDEIDSVEGLLHSDSQDEFDKLLERLTEKPDSRNEAREPSPFKRPESPLSDFHDDGSDTSDIANGPPPNLYSDVESIPEEIG